MSSELPREPALEPEILTLLERERSDPYGDTAGARKAALARRLEHAALAIAVTSAAPLAGVAAEAARRALAPSVGTHAKRVVAWGLATKIGVASVLVVAGGGAGALLEARYGERAPAAAPVLAARSAASVPAASRPSGESADHTPPPVIPSPGGSGGIPPAVDVDSLPSVIPSRTEGHAQPAPSSSAAASPHATVTSGSEELLLLDTARTAVARGAFSAALATLTDCADRFPHGKHAEERELLFVQALEGAGRTAEAATRARAFEARFPESIFLPAVRAASSTKDP